MVAFRMNYELKKVYKVIGRVLIEINSPIICLKGLRKPMKNVSHDSRCPRPGSNRSPPEYKSKSVTDNFVNYAILYVNGRARDKNISRHYLKFFWAEVFDLKIWSLFRIRKGGLINPFV